jgi:hypothetical protein
MLPLARWLANTPDPDARRRGALALGVALRALFDSGTWLPRFGAKHVHLSASRAGCAHSAPVVAGLRMRRLPEVAFTGLRGGRIVGRLSKERRRELLSRLAAEADVAPRIALRVAWRALGPVEARSWLQRRGERA